MGEKKKETENKTRLTKKVFIWKWEKTFVFEISFNKLKTYSISHEILGKCPTFHKEHPYGVQFEF